MIEITSSCVQEPNQKSLQVRPTVFPDGTSQVWKLPEEFLKQTEVQIIWRFEEERELIDILSIHELLRAQSANGNIKLHIPYFPFARQDKTVNNQSTFNLHPFCKVLQSLSFNEVSAVDVHNPAEIFRHLPDFKNLPIAPIHQQVIKNLCPDWIVFPDAGAKRRYSDTEFSKILVFEKRRDQASGEILGHELCLSESSPQASRGLRSTDTFLILDDICDGGATFISIAKKLKLLTASFPRIHLFVTHGIFSKGREQLEKEAITLHTTNSLPRNSGVADGQNLFDVCYLKQRSTI